jgi:hypothetical protein
MPFFADDDIPSMLADWGSSITIGGVNAPCIFDEAAEVVLQQDGVGGQITIMPVALIQRTAFPSANKDDAVVVDGVSYIIYEALPIGDGALVRLALRKV